LYSAPQALITVFEAQVTGVTERLPLSRATSLAFLPPPSSFSRTTPYEDSSWQSRHNLLSQDFDRLHGCYIVEQQLRAKERHTFIAEVSRRETAEMHAALARHEIQRLQFLLNAKEDRTKSGPSEKIRATGLLTTAEGLAARSVQRQARNDKAAAEDTRQIETERRQTANTERRQLLLHSSDVFDGKLSTKKRPDWQDIAFTLGLPIEVTAAELTASIYQHLKVRPHLCSGRYALVWESLSKQADRKAAKDGIDGMTLSARIV
jgi:hypothetical protein